jgi:hypothetical protein
MAAAFNDKSENQSIQKAIERLGSSPPVGQPLDQEHRA